MKSLKMFLAIAFFFGAFSSFGQTTLNVCNGTPACQMVLKLEIKADSTPCDGTFAILHGVGVLGCEPITIPDGFEFVSATIMNGADMIPLTTLQPPVTDCDYGYPTTETIETPCGGNTITATWDVGGIFITL